MVFGTSADPISMDGAYVSDGESAEADLAELAPKLGSDVNVSLKSRPALIAGVSHI